MLSEELKKELEDDIFLKRKKDFLKISEELAEQFYSKNKDYNDSFFNIDTYGFPVDKILSKIDLYVQLRRKFSRLASFAEKKLQGQESINNVKNESEEDTIKDIIIYGVMFIMKDRIEDENK